MVVVDCYFFLIRLFVSRDFFSQGFWVRTSFLFLAVCLLSASFSELSKLATLETLAWFGFLFCNGSHLLARPAKSIAICDVYFHRIGYVSHDWDTICRADY